MARIHRVAAVVGAAALASAALATPARAAGTVINWDTSAAYSGTATAQLTGNLVISGGGTTTCTSSSLGGSVTSGGALTISSASVTGCSGTASAITPQGLSWSGSVNYVSPTAPQGTVVLNGFSMRATVLGVNCTYGANITAPATNPVGGDYAKVSLAGITIPKTAGIFLCPGSASITQGTYNLVGAGGVRLGMTP
ncbi:hypothetical protein LO762_31440 [Actinocorallia sp. API 0066]|uniref:hypothetical protein n=1 Tax=Actinocorallia sp. API 0066 TaxID=2896846 RepID=UPI001E50C92A|nr:hypothetical protein [Actinocorallia sp. API 0066]MCD0453666.1 hypothetical protein [Actinocorallia sp. API 0066]